jgi:queuine/archaeosine tRNA-ribosyltransferase
MITQHNLHFYGELMAEMRRHILEDTFAAYRLDKRQEITVVDRDFPALNA